jgi:hypothetical protein
MVPLCAQISYLLTSSLPSTKLRAENGLIFSFASSRRRHTCCRSQAYNQPRLLLYLLHIWHTTCSEDCLRFSVAFFRGIVLGVVRQNINPKECFFQSGIWYHPVTIVLVIALESQATLKLLNSHRWTVRLSLWYVIADCRRRPKGGRRLKL